MTQTIAEKEKKSASYKEGRLDTLSEEKTAKIKKFAKEYIAKILRKLEKSGQRRKPSSSNGAAGSSATPDGIGGGADDLIVTEATVADVMDLDPHDEPDEDDNGDEEHLDGEHADDEPGDNDRASGSGSPEDGAGSGETSPTVVSDPRTRHRPSSRDGGGSAWDAEVDLQKSLSSSWNAVPVGS